MKRKVRKILAVLLIVAICVTTTDINAFAAKNSGLEQASIEEVVRVNSSALKVDAVVEESAQNSWDGETTESVYDIEECRVIFSLSSHWSGGYNANIKIENTSESVIENWCLCFDSRNTISNIWNAEIQEHNAGKYVIKNAGWNQDIAVGESVQFGFSGSEDFMGFPNGCNLLGQNTETNKGDYIVEYYLNDDWGSGFTGTISITNSTDSIIEDWSIEFYFDRTITNVWDGVIEKQEGNHYVIKNAGYNGNIAAGQTISFGFNGKDGTEENVPYEYMLYSYEMNNTEYVELSDGKIDKNYLEKAIYKYLLLQDMSIDNIRLSDDYDEDGLNDYEEIYGHGTNPIKDDSDEDEMSDGTEVACGLNPLNSDTNENGVEDNQETVTQDVRIDTVEKYNLQEVGTLPSIVITGKGDYSQKIYATAIKNDATITDIDCLVGTPFDFVHDEELSFEHSQLTFTISNEILENNKLEELAIAWYNDEENALELLDTTYDIEKHTLSAEVNHYSTYMVVSVPKYFFFVDWQNAGNIVESGKADVVFVVDTTGSMESEIQNVKDNIETFVSELEENKVDIRLGLVEYKDIYANGIDSTKNYGWYTDVSDFETALSSLDVSGGGGDGPESVVDALYCARNMEYRVGVKKYIILLTDANYNNGNSVNSKATLADEIEKIVDEEIVASALAPLISKMSEQANERCWVRLANGSIVFLDKDPTLGDESVDTDEDGVPDVIELKSSYTVLAYNPYIEKMQEINAWSFYSNPAKEDTDEDTLSDLDDLKPTEYDVIVIEENNNHIAFNTGNEWNIITCTAFDYLDNVLQAVDLNVENPIPVEELGEIAQNVIDNKNQDFLIEELAYIGVVNNEGAKLYMHEMSETKKETVFQQITGRESNYYKHSGIWWDENWSKVPKGTESGFFKGIVLSEADLNLSWKIYNVSDVYKELTKAAKMGALVIAVVVVIDATPVVLANLQGLAYYVKTFGVVQGFQMYQYLGIQNLPNGVISWLQMDMADGNSSLDDLVDGAFPFIKGEKQVNKHWL